MDTHVWLHHAETGGYWECPVPAVDDWRSRGWVPSDPPPPAPDPAVAEGLAWREQQAAASADTPPTTTRARRGSTKEQ
ncbi:hypothetical protein ACFHW1_04935 [Micromonospora sp. LOL_014]|uniref:hypothetical protein n=1 Tax=Micromonospora sp. LOL_014 TaxID=3345415 RepID=UPI003A8C1297